MNRATRRLYCKSILLRRGVLLILFLAYALLLSLNFLLYAQVKDSVELKRTLRECPYTHVGISGARLSQSDVFERYDAVLLSREVDQTDGGALYRDRVSVVALAELPDAEYTALSPFGEGLVVEGEYARLSRGEIAISKKVAEATGVGAGGYLYVSSADGPLRARVRYVYRELYSIVDINMSREVYSVLLSGEDRFEATAPTFLHYRSGADNNVYLRICLKADELDGVGSRFWVLALAFSLAVTALCCLLFKLCNRRVRAKTAKMRSCGFGRAAIMGVHAFRLLLPLLPAALLLFGAAAILGVQPFFYLFSLAQVLLIFGIQLWLCDH